MVIFLPARAAIGDVGVEPGENRAGPLTGSMSFQVTYEVIPLIAGIADKLGLLGIAQPRGCSAKYPGLSMAGVGVGVGRRGRSGRRDAVDGRRRRRRAAAHADTRQARAPSAAIGG
jgi:hypothetical protein